jgi:multisubunit Na+/H+ antiporter MnhE subunit
VSAEEKVSRRVAMGSLTGGASMGAIFATFFGHPERKRISRRRLSITTQGLRIISIFSFQIIKSHLSVQPSKF